MKKEKKNKWLEVIGWILELAIIIMLIIVIVGDQHRQTRCDQLIGELTIPDDEGIIYKVNEEYGLEQIDIENWGDIEGLQNNKS